MTEIVPPERAAIDAATARFRALITGETMPEFAPYQVPSAEAGPSSWKPADLRGYLDGSYAVPQPTLMPRADGRCLLYPGKVHSLVGESESGKSLLAQLESIRLINAGQDVLYVDFEDQAGGVVERMLTFGAHPNALMAHFSYVNPEVSFRGSADDLQAWQALLGKPFALAVIDGVNDSLTMFGLSANAGDEVSEWQQNVARRLARKTGAAVLLIDHVTKSHEGRGRSAIGSEKKLSGLDGCSYTVEPTTMPRKGHTGWIEVKVGKDRPGGVRPYCGPPGRDRLQLAVTVKVDSTGEHPLVYWNAPDTEEPQLPAAEDKLAVAMQKVSLTLEEIGEPISKNALFLKVGGARNICMAAIEELHRTGYVELESGPRNSVLVKSTQIYVNEAPVPTCTPLVLVDPRTGAADLYSASPPLGEAGSTGQAGLSGEVTCTEALVWDVAISNATPNNGAAS